MFIILLYELSSNKTLYYIDNNSDETTNNYINIIKNPDIIRKIYELYNDVIFKNVEFEFTHFLADCCLRLQRNKLHQLDTSSILQHVKQYILN